MAGKEAIKVGFCVAYDWHLLKYALPPVYALADRICLSIDKDRISWNSAPFIWDEEGFRTLVREIDKDGKIEVLEEDYHLTELKPMENEVRQRNRIATHLGDGGWHVQLDTDEFFINFSGFVSFLQGLNPARKINVACPLITLYKQDEQGFYYIDSNRFEEVEYIQIATKWPVYEYGRRNGNFNIYTDFAILHLSWARPEAEIWAKLNNWGHRDDLDIEKYFQQWKDLSQDNYLTYRSFHHLTPTIWPKMGFQPAKSIESLIAIANSAFHLPIRRSDLQKHNNIWRSRLTAVIRRLLGPRVK